MRVAAPGHVVAGARNGLLFESRNGGATWTHVPFPGSNGGSGALHTLEIDARRPQVWFAAMDSGLYRTADGGRTWTKPPDLSSKAVWAVAVWPGDPSIVAAGAGDGIYLSHDSGNSWQRISPEDNRDLRPVVSVAFHPTNRKTIYAGTTHLPWRTADGGATWSSIHAGMLDDSDVFSIVVNRSTPRNMFASACSGVYRSDDGGGKWKRLPTPTGAFRAYLVAADPRRPEVVLAATSAGLLKSSNGGASWKRISSHIVKSVAFDPGDPRKIHFASTTGGLLVSRDGGDTLVEFNTGFTAANFFSAAASGNSIYTVTLPENGGIFRSSDLGLSWRRLGMPSKGVAPSLLAAAPDNAATVYAGDLRDIYRSADAGASWERIAGPGAPASSIAALPGGVLLAGTASGLYRSFGRTGWTRALPGAVERIQLSGSVPGVIAGGKAFRGDAAGARWTACGSLPVQGTWYGIAFDRDPSGPVYAATSTGLFMSSDGCRTFRAIPGLDRATSGAVVAHPERAGEAFAAQNGRVYQTTDAGRSWTVLDDDGMQGSYPAALMIVPGAPRRIFALIPGRGLLSVPLFRLP